MDQIFQRVRAMTLPEGSDSLDRMAMLKLRVLDVAETADPAALAAPIDAVTREALSASSEPEIPSTRIARISLLIEEVQKSMAQRAIAAPAARDRLKGHGDTLEQAAEAIFQKSLDVKPAPDLNVYLAYADHLRFRDRRDRCLAVSTQGLKSPPGSSRPRARPPWGCTPWPSRPRWRTSTTRTASPPPRAHVKSLLECKDARYQGWGTCSRGRSTWRRPGWSPTPRRGRRSARAAQAKLRAGALNHLKIAAAQLPEVAEAQALTASPWSCRRSRPGPAVPPERACGMGNLEPQYQIWAAWSIVQAGYPEEAEPIVDQLLGQVAAGHAARASSRATLHLLSGEIHQARAGPGDLKQAPGRVRQGHRRRARRATPAVQLRLAQIDVQLGQPEPTP